MIIKTVEITEDGEELVSFFEQSQVRVESTKEVVDKNSKPVVSKVLYFKDGEYLSLHPNQRNTTVYIMNDKGKTVEVYRNT